MADDKSNKDPSDSAESAFSEFMERRKGGDQIDFDVYCTENSSLAAALEGLAGGREDADIDLLQMILNSEVGSDADVRSAIVKRLSESTLSVTPNLDDPSKPNLGAGHIGPYKILEPIGEGGFGEVYLAEQIEPVRRRVALKVIKLGMDTRDVVARFEAERQALALMDHPNVARVLDAGATDQGRPYFVMEYVPGTSITEYCDRQRLSTRERLDLFIEVCDAVQHAHQKGIIHRDIKPSNILVADQHGKRTPKVIDFGIAKALHTRLTEKSVYTQHGLLIGTPEYMSPEQAEMTVHDIDTRTDIYSLGVVLYELLVGELPFDTNTLRRGGREEIQRVIREENPLKPSSRVSSKKKATEATAQKRSSDAWTLERQIRGDLDWITMKAMEKDRTRRYASASELALDISRHLHHEPVLASPPSTAYRVAKFYHRNRTQVWAGVLGSVLLAAIAVVTWYVSERRNFQEQVLKSANSLDQGVDELDRYRGRKESLRELKSAWEIAGEQLETWQPVWERTDEIAAWKRYSTAGEELDRHYSSAVLTLSRAIDFAPSGSEQRVRCTRALEDVYWERYQEAQALGGGGTLGTGYYKSMLQSLNLGTYADRLEGKSTLTFQSDPPGAEVFCFRYREYEQHLLPIAFDPKIGLETSDSGFLDRPFLEVETVWDASRSPFRSEDRLNSVAGHDVSLRGEFAAALSNVAADEAISVQVVREQQKVTLDWIPFPKDHSSNESVADGARLEPGRVLSIRKQFGFSFAGYPLSFVDRGRVGTTKVGSPLVVEVPSGSYVFVLRKKDHRDTRLPVSVPTDQLALRVRLFRENETPPGFVYIPAGSFGYGGDPGAFESLEGDETSLDDFFISRFEITKREYLEFLNDPENEIGDDGRASPRAAAVKREVEEIPNLDFVLLKPGKIGIDADWIRGPDGVWTTDGNLDAPVHYISHHAALEYCHWRTTRDGGRWRYRLPTDLEWEKAARGVDRRIYVWGNYLVWNFCRSANGRLRGVSGLEEVRVQPIGAAPLDESVYGVRDMAGSVEEHVAGTTITRSRFRSRRGGGFWLVDEPMFRIANRNGILPHAALPGLGFRLIAERP